MTSSFDPLATFLASLGPVGTGVALAAIPVVAGAAAYVTRMGSQAKIDRLEGEMTALAAAHAKDAASEQLRYAALEERYDTIRRAGAMIHAQLEAIRTEASDAADRLDAADHAVFVPAPTSISGDVPDELVFLCASGTQQSKLKWVRVPIASSLAGQSFVSGRATIAAPPNGGTGFASRTDEVAQYKTNEALSVCLRYRGQHVGVAQFLNKRSGRFDSADVERAVVQCTTLAVRVGDFTADPRQVIEMGHAPRRDQVRASFIFGDLTGFSRLFDHLDSSVITDLLNEYFEAVSAVALGHGAVIDQYIGDGLLLVFHAGPKLAKHEQACVIAAQEMRAAFRTVRQRWATLGYQGADALFVRLGLSCGPVTRAEVGHAQSRRMTVIGPAVNAAARACEGAPRVRDTICMTRELRQALANDAAAPAVAVPGTDLFELPG